MLVLVASREVIIPLVEEFDGAVDIAAFDGPQSIVVAATLETLGKFGHFSPVELSNHSRSVWNVVLPGSKWT